MLHTKAFVKKTKAGKILRVVREHYVRDDIQCAFSRARFRRQMRSGAGRGSPPAVQSALCLADSRGRVVVAYYQHPIDAVSLARTVRLSGARVPLQPLVWCRQSTLQHVSRGCNTTGRNSIA